MYRLLSNLEIPEQKQEVIARTETLIAAAGTGTSFAVINEWLQLVSVAVAYRRRDSRATWWYLERI